MTSLNMDSAFSFWITSNTGSHSMRDVVGSLQKLRDVSHLTDRGSVQQVLQRQTAGTKTVQ